VIFQRNAFEKMRARRKSATTFFQAEGLTVSSRKSVIGYRQS
jgi:hypothetical protein